MFERFVIVEEAAFAMKPPERYDSPVEVAPTTEIFVGEKFVALRLVVKKLVEEALVKFRVVAESVVEVAFVVVA